MSYLTCNHFEFKPVIGHGLNKIPNDIHYKDGIYIYDSENSYDLDIDWLCGYICGFAPDTVFIGCLSRYSNGSCDTTFFNYIFSKQGCYKFNEECPESGTDVILDDDLIIRGFTNGGMYGWIDNAKHDDLIIQTHAKWIGPKHKYYCECSECGAMWDGYYTAIQAKQTMPYCSACGAKMDLE